MSLVSKYPSVAQDAGLAFPTKIVRCSVNGESLHDLIVMPKAKGEDFSVFIGEKWYSGINSGQPDGKNEVFRAMEQLGRQLKEFHVRYGGAQHGDFQPSNVFYDRNANAFTFIDLANMGGKFKADHDVQQFNRVISSFGAATYGPAFVQQSQSSFGRGYASL
jgi:tRNA A-37 threonylcarbamoyl transferase component Bud32